MRRQLIFLYNLRWLHTDFAPPNGRNFLQYVLTNLLYKTLFLQFCLLKLNEIHFRKLLNVNLNHIFFIIFKLNAKFIKANVNFHSHPVYLKYAFLWIKYVSNTLIKCHVVIK